MWWEYVIGAVVLILVVYGFAVMTGFQTRRLTNKTDRTAESMYGNYADSRRKQQRFARKHGGQWKDDDEA